MWMINQSTVTTEKVFGGTAVSIQLVRFISVLVATFLEKPVANLLDDQKNSNINRKYNWRNKDNNFDPAGL